MSFDWNNFLVLAEELAQRGDEAAKRTAISRAYYFIFNLAYARAEVSGGIFVAGDRHAQCWRRYMATPDPACQKLGIAGDRMKGRRISADYEAPTKARLDDEVRRSLEEARQFSADLTALPTRFPLS
jgi:hypothetical protein